MNSSRPATTGRFTTFGGVFTPCTLTILGVIMFLRFGNVVGNAGLVHAILIVIASKIITTLTTLSLSAIATNTRVKGGGAYFLISRSLGVEYGGAIGTVFFLAQAISVAMYVIGFTEAWVDAIGGGQYSTIIASIVNLIVFACVFIGAGWTIKLQYGILALLGLSLFSFFYGAGQAFDSARLTASLGSNYEMSGESFFTMFALFFPAVTGIMAGANMSGDLKDPAKSIPSGTLLAVLVTGIVYIVQAVMLAGARTPVELTGDNLVIKGIAWSPLLITAGVFAATLSSALGSMMGAPRILQALAKDRVFPVLEKYALGSGRDNEPRRATILTFMISQTCIVLGDLDAIAPVITMFFMITYGTLNLATFLEAITRNPSYRPRFKYSHWVTSLLGALGCLSVMFLIDWQWATFSLLAMAALHRWISKQEIEARWGDMQSGLKFERTRRNLLLLERQLAHPKNWRPIILTLSGSAAGRPRLSVYGHYLTAGHGILTLAQIIQGDAEELAERRKSQEEILKRFIADHELEAFPAVCVSPYLTEGIESLVQCVGLGALRPNTVLLGWPGSEDRAVPFGAHLRLIRKLNRSIVIARFRLPESRQDEDPWDIPTGTIDVWWRGKDNGALMLMLGHLLQRNRRWRNNSVRLLRVISAEAGREEVTEHLTQLANSARINAEPLVLVSDSVVETIQQASRDSAVTILGFEPPGDGDEVEFFKGIDALAGNLPQVLFVNSAGGMQLES